MNKNSQYESYGIKVNLMSLAGASMCPLTGQSGATKVCIIIPVEDNNLVEGSKGVYLNLNATRCVDGKNGWEYVLRNNLPQDEYRLLTAGERQQLPTVGVMRRLTAPQTTEEYWTIEDNSNLNF